MSIRRLRRNAKAMLLRASRRFERALRDADLSSWQWIPYWNKYGG